MPVTSRGHHTRHQHRLHGYRLHRCLSPPEDTTHGISIDCRGIGSISIGNCHLQRMPDMVSVSTAWVYGSGMIHGAINCNNYKSDTSRRCHTRHGYRLHRYGYHGHGYRVPPEQDATHGIGIGCMGISSMSIGTCHHRTRKRHQHQLHGYGYHGHGYRVPPEQDATHGISIDCMGIGSISIGNCHLQRTPHTASVSVQWVSWP